MAKLRLIWRPLTLQFLFRRASLQVSRSRVRKGFHPTFQSPAAFKEPRVADRAAQESTFPLQHLRKRLRHRVLPPHSQRKGNVSKCSPKFVAGSFSVVYRERKCENGRIHNLALPLFSILRERGVPGFRKLLADFFRPFLFLRHKTAKALIKSSNIFALFYGPSFPFCVI